MAEEQLIDGSNAFILDALLPTEEQAKENNTVQVKLEFFQVEIYPLTFRQGDSVDLDNPHLHCQENIFMSPNLLLSPKSNPHMELQSGV